MEPTHGRIDVNGDLKIRSLLSAVDRSLLVTPVTRLWHTIIARFFPIPEGYVCYFKTPHIAKEEIRGAEVFGVQRALCGAENPEEFIKKEILVILCKNPTFDTPEGWKGSEKVLEPYMVELEHSATARGPPAEFVAVVIGRRVQFYKWRPEEVTKMEKLHDEPLDLAISQDAETASNAMNNFKVETWDHTKWKSVQAST